jgi:hypothetical protein
VRVLRYIANAEQAPLAQQDAKDAVVTGQVAEDFGTDRDARLGEVAQALLSVGGRGHRGDAETAEGSPRDSARSMPTCRLVGGQGKLPRLTLERSRRP